MSLPTYSPKRLVITAGGQAISGFSDSDILSVALDEDKFVKYVSVDGQVSRSFNVADSGKFVLTLNQTSKANLILNSLLKADALDNTGRLTFPMYVADGNSEGTFFIGSNCWVAGMPECKYVKEIEVREWVIEAEKIAYNITGNGGNSLLNTASQIASAFGALLG